VLAGAQAVEEQKGDKGVTTKSPERRKTAGGVLVEKEAVGVGSVGLKVYKAYVKA
jgi:hypothetical protein